MPRILIVDNDVTISMRMEEILGSMDYDVVGVASSGEEAVVMAKKHNPDLILMDIVMPGGMDGIDAVERIKAEQGIPVIFVTGHPEERFIERAKLVEPFGYILKPFQEDQIKATIDIALYKKEMERQHQKTHRELERKIDKLELTEEELKSSQLWLNSIFNSLDEAVFVVTPDRKLVNINEAAQRMFGYTGEELSDLSTEVLHVDHDHFVEFGKKIREAFDNGKTANFEFQARRKNSEIFPTEHTVKFLRGDNGEPAGIVSVVRDITDRKFAKEALENAHHELEQKVEARTAEVMKTNEELELKTQELNEINSALNVLLKKRETDKQEVEEKVISNVRELIEPYLEKLMNTNLAADQRTYLNILQTNLSDIVSPFLRNLTMNFSGLTPKEIQVASLVKEGENTKEIARLLNTTKRAVEFHRHSLRTKLGLKNKKANLRSHLLSLP